MGLAPAHLRPDGDRRRARWRAPVRRVLGCRTLAHLRAACAHAPLDATLRERYARALKRERERLDTQAEAFDAEQARLLRAWAAED